MATGIYHRFPIRLINRCSSVSAFLGLAGVYGSLLIPDISIHIFEALENLRYSIYITTQKGEPELMDLPFLFFQSYILRTYDLTQKLKMRYVAYIRLVSLIFLKKLIFEHLSTNHHPTSY